MIPKKDISQVTLRVSDFFLLMSKTRKVGPEYIESNILNVPVNNIGETAKVLFLRK